MEIQNYYCSQKFDWVEVRLYDGLVASCCQSTTHRLTLSELESHPVGFFNYPVIHQERQLMLDNVRTSSCESCWKVEENNINSRRTLSSSDIRKYHQLEQLPKTVNLVLSNTCLQSCVYCGKVYSHTWLNDVATNGDYNIPGYNDRYNINQQDKILLRLGQKELHQTRTGELILNQIESASANIEKLIITGGEPLLDNQLIKIVERLQNIPEIVIFTGLGINLKRLEKICADLKKYTNISFTVSAENTGTYHEFNRYGTTYSNWLENYNIISNNFPVSFASVVSNLTLFGLHDFMFQRSNSKISFYYNNDPVFLSPNMLDNTSKKNIEFNLLKINHPEIDNIIKYMNQPSDDINKESLKTFLVRFSQTRNLKLNLFPATFLKWIGI